jgi:hypothetical protein
VGVEHKSALGDRAEQRLFYIGLVAELQQAYWLAYFKSATTLDGTGWV